MMHQNELPLFHGVPISIKDILSTAGIRTTRGSRAFVHDVPGTDDNDVARLKGAGFIMLGKTNTPEFALYPWTEPELFGPTRNPQVRPWLVEKPTLVTSVVTFGRR